MASVKDIYGSVYERSAANLLARVVNANGDVVMASDTASIFIRSVSVMLARAMRGLWFQDMTEICCQSVKSW